MINKSEYLAIVVTNQPVIAKGFCSEDDVREIHSKMEQLIGLENAYLDKNIFFVLIIQKADLKVR